MNFEDYKNQLDYPNKTDFSITFFYSKGQVIGQYPSSNTKEIERIKKEHPGCISEKVTDEEGFKKAQAAYGARSSELEQKFVRDCMQECFVPDNEFTRKLYAISYERGHSAGYSEVFNIFNDLTDLHSIAQRVYGKQK